MESHYHVLYLWQYLKRKKWASHLYINRWLMCLSLGVYLGLWIPDSLQCLVPGHKEMLKWSISLREAAFLIYAPLQHFLLTALVVPLCTCWILWISIQGTQGCSKNLLAYITPLYLLFCLHWEEWEKSVLIHFLLPYSERKNRYA